MKMSTLAAALAAAVCMAALASGGTASATSAGLQLAQAGVDVQIGPDRDRDRYYDRRDRRNSDLTIGVGPGGVRVGPRERCRTVTTTVQRDDGRSVTRRERQCD
jgi:hypothetical protein